MHYGQGFFYGKFRQFDLGRKLNLAIYNSVEPPDYNLKNVKAPMYIYRAPEDLLTSKRVSL